MTEIMGDLVKNDIGSAIEDILFLKGRIRILRYRANTRAIHDLAWDCRRMLYKYFQVDYQQFFRVR